MSQTNPILVLTTEPLPLPEQAATGAGLRAWGLTQGLRSRNLNVVAAMPIPANDTPDPEILRAHGVSLFNRNQLHAFVREINPRAIILQHWALTRELGDVKAPVAIDLAGPQLLERLYWESPDPEEDRCEKIEALNRADFLCCSGKYQRHYFLPFLADAGWDITQPDVLPIISFSLDPHQPKPEKRDPYTFVYGGYFLPWQDPGIALKACLEAMDEENAGRLEFFGGMHPRVDVSAGKFDSLMEQLANHPRVTLCGSLPFHELTQRYCRAGLAIDLMARNPERELAFTTRTLVYLWCGLPTLYNNYSELSYWIERYDAGVTLNSEDSIAVKQCIQKYLRNPKQWDARRQSTRRLMREQFDWTQTIGPLADWCVNPCIRKGKEQAAQSATQCRLLLKQTEKKLQKTQSDLDTLQGKWHVRLAKRISGGGWPAPLVWLALTPLSWIVRNTLQRAEKK